MQPVAPRPTGLPSLRAQAERLVELGVHRLAGATAEDVLGWAGSASRTSGLLVVHPTVVPPSALARLLGPDAAAEGVADGVADIDTFDALPAVRVPAGPAYRLSGPERGDTLANWSAEEVLPIVLSTGRTPLTVTEGLHWAIQAPDLLARNRCFMTLGSRLTKPDGRRDARVPVVRARAGVPVLDACRAGDRHAWAGFASAAGRHGIRR